MQASEAAQAISIAAASVEIATMGCVLLTSIMSLTSFATIWSMVNQLQLLLLLLLTRAFIPGDIQAVLTGSDFASNLYQFIPIKMFRVYPAFLSRFEFELTNQSLSLLEINYDSTVANTYSIFFSIFLMTLFHLTVCIVR